MSRLSVSRAFKWSCLLLMLPFLRISVSAQTGSSADLLQHVDPFIGTAGHGHVFLGANVPYGAVQLGPSNIMQTWDKFNGWDWCSGYNYISKEILGFTHTHLSGTGIGDLNDILVLPANGKAMLRPAKFNNMNSGYGSGFSHEKEKCSPGFYSVHLDKYNVDARLTTSARVGFHEYRFGKTDNAHLLVDLSFGMGWDAATDTYFRQLDDSTFLGYRFSSGWAKDQRVFFAMRLSTGVKRMELYEDTLKLEGNEAQNKRLKALLYLDLSKDAIVKLKVGLSPVSPENALANIEVEIPHWDFDKALSAAEEKWNGELSKIVIDADEKVKKIFYTSLYHTLFFPSVFNDVTREYRGTDKKVYTDPGFDNHTIYSLWDTYRGLHPLMTIIHPEKVNDQIRSFLEIYKQQGKLPVWHLQGNETNTMVGYPAVPIIVDAYLKGYRNYDIKLAYEAVRHSAMQQSDGIQYVQKMQFIPADSVVESVAKAQEYAISDWCIAQMANDMGKMDDHKYFSERSKLYSQYFERSTGHMRGRLSIDQWRTPFNPFNAAHRQNDYCEGNGWQYTWLVPHDVPGLISLFGGDRPFLNKLDSLFTVPAAGLNADASPDISGMIGQYAHGNEPNHHIPYLYNYAGQPWKGADRIRQVMDTFYTDRPDGICGNEDAGEMSAWYVLSAIGFYPVNPANGQYVFGSPIINEAIINVGQNRRFNIRVLNQGRKNNYIQKILLNGRPYTKSYILHRDIVSGGDMTIEMGARPSKTFGLNVSDRPR